MALAALRVAALALLFLVCAPIHLLTKVLTGASPWPQRFLGAAAWLIGVRVRIDGAPAGPHNLLIVNHLSWLDIMVIGGTTGAAFVSKDDLGHGFIHWLADQNGTVYVRRSHLKGAKTQAMDIAAALERDKPVALFPEGTVGPGTQLLPFRSTLLEAANYAAKDVEIRPVALDYGPAAAEIAWYEEPAKDNIRRILGRRGVLPVTLKMLDALSRGSDRKQLAAEARRAIGSALGFKSDEASPIGQGQ